MGKEMAGSDNRELDELMPLAKVGEVDSSFGEGKTDIVDVRYLDFEQAINEFARRSCIPSAEIYKNSPELKNNPLEASKHVEVSPDAMSMITDTETAVVAEISRLQTAEENLKLSPQQKEVFEGLKQNQKGALAWISAMAGAIKDPNIRRKVIAGTVAGLEILGLAGCAIRGAVAIPAETDFPTESPEVQTTDNPGFIPLTETPPVEATPIGAIPTETQPVPTVEVPHYPSSSEGLITTPGLSGIEAENRIIALGAGDSLKAIKDWYKANGIPESNLVAVIYEGNTGAFWNLAAKGQSGNFLEFKLTSGPESGQVVRAMGLINYLYDKPSFSTFELQNPSGFEGATQQMIWDGSGWNVVGLFSNDGNFVGWFNADRPGGGEWQISPIAAVTPEPTYAVSEPEYEHAMVEWDKTTLELGNGHTLDYVIGVEPGFDISTVWGQWRTESIEVNENLPDHEKILADVISHSLYEAYLVKGSQISYEEFMKNPQWYPIPLVMPDGQGGFVTKPFTLNQLSRIEQCWVSREDPRLYLRVPSVAPTGRFGYEFADNGKTLVVYATLHEEHSMPSGYIEFANDNPFLNIAMGSSLGENIIVELLLAGYSYLETIDGPQPRVDAKYLAHFKAIQDAVGYPIKVVTGESLSDYIAKYSIKGLFVAKLTPN